MYLQSHDVEQSFVVMSRNIIDLENKCSYQLYGFSMLIFVILPLKHQYEVMNNALTSRAKCINRSSLTANTQIC